MYPAGTTIHRTFVPVVADPMVAVADYRSGEAGLELRLGAFLREAFGSSPGYH